MDGVHDLLVSQFDGHLRRAVANARQNVSLIATVGGLDEKPSKVLLQRLATRTGAARQDISHVVSGFAES